MMSERPENEKLLSGNAPIVTREIQGVSYHVTRLGWWALLDALNAIEKIVGPSLESLLDMIGSDIESESSSGGESVARGAALLISRATDVEGKKLLKTLGTQTMIETDSRKVWLTEEILDVWFCQHPEQAIEWLIFCLEVQFRDFFERPMLALGEKLGAQKMGTKASSSPTT